MTVTAKLPLTDYLVHFVNEDKDTVRTPTKLKPDMVRALNAISKEINALGDAMAVARTQLKEDETIEKTLNTYRPIVQGRLNDVKVALKTKYKLGEKEAHIVTSHIAHTAADYYFDDIANKLPKGILAIVPAVYKDAPLEERKNSFKSLVRDESVFPLLVGFAAAAVVLFAAKDKIFPDAASAGAKALEAAHPEYFNEINLKWAEQFKGVDISNLSDMQQRFGGTISIPTPDDVHPRNVQTITTREFVEHVAPAMNLLEEIGKGTTNIASLLRESGTKSWIQNIETNRLEAVPNTAPAR